MARSKPKANIIQDMAQADEVLARIGMLQRSISQIEGQMNASIDKAKAEAKELSAPIKAQIKELETALATFAEFNKADLFTKKRSMELDFGIFGFRKSSKLKTKTKWKWDMVLEKIKEYGFLKAIRLKEDVNKDELRTWPRERLDSVGVELQETDEFYYEIDETKLQDAA